MGMNDSELFDLGKFTDDKDTTDVSFQAGACFGLTQS